MNPLSEQAATQKEIKKGLIHIHSPPHFQSDLKFPHHGSHSISPGTFIGKLEAKTEGNSKIAPWVCAWLCVRKGKIRKNRKDTAEGWKPPWF